MFGPWAVRQEPWLEEREYQFSHMDQRPVMCECAECGGVIHSEDDYYEADDAFLFENGDVICRECLYTYADKHLRI